VRWMPARAARPSCESPRSARSARSRRPKAFRLHALVAMTLLDYERSNIESAVEPSRCDDVALLRGLPLDRRRSANGAAEGEGARGGPQGPIWRRAGAPPLDFSGKLLPPQGPEAPRTNGRGDADRGGHRSRPNPLGDARRHYWGDEGHSAEEVGLVCGAGDGGRTTASRDCDRSARRQGPPSRLAMSAFHLTSRSSCGSGTMAAA
jgi:hypothetical protein